MLDENIKNKEEKIKEVTWEDFIVKKGTIFSGIPQGSDENGNPIVVDRPLLEDIILTKDLMVATLEKLYKQNEVMKQAGLSNLTFDLTDPKSTIMQIILWIACDRGIIDLKGVKLKAVVKN